MAFRYLLLATCMIASAPASAVVLVDVDNLKLGASSVWSAVYSASSDREELTISRDLYQSFTAEHSGILNAIQIWGGYVGSGGTRLRIGDEVYPSFITRGVVHLDAASFNTSAGSIGLNTFDVSALAFTVMAGQSYSFAITPDVCLTTKTTDCRNEVYVGEHNGYTGGQATFVSFLPHRLAFTGFDLSFRTFVDVATPGAVPEPSTWAMMLVSFGAIGFAMRHKQRQTVRYNLA